MNKWWLRGALLSSFVVLAACSSSKPSTSNNNTGGQNAGGQNNGGTGNEGGSTGGTGNTGGNTGGSGNTGPVCGDGTCDPGETMNSCPQDCGDPPPDCTEEADFQTCASCFAEEFPDGAALFNEFAACVICVACYDVCDGANSGCQAPPASTDACDTGTPGDAACQACIMCAQQPGGVCEPQLQACASNQECLDFDTAIKDCPQ